MLTFFLETGTEDDKLGNLLQLVVKLVNSDVLWEDRWEHFDRQRHINSLSSSLFPEEKDSKWSEGFEMQHHTSHITFTLTSLSSKMSMVHKCHSSINTAWMPLMLYLWKYLVLYSKGRVIQPPSLKCCIWISLQETFMNGPMWCSVWRSLWNLSQWNTLWNNIFVCKPWSFSKKKGVFRVDVMWSNQKNSFKRFLDLFFKCLNSDLYVCVHSTVFGCSSRKMAESKPESERVVQIV